MLDFIEKRKFPRAKVSLPLRYKKLRGNTYLAKGTLTKDLSEGGIRFLTNVFLPLACHLVVEIMLPRKKPIKVICKIAWIRKRRSDSSYEIGNQFLAMSDKDETTISAYARKLTEQLVTTYS